MRESDERLLRRVRRDLERTVGDGIEVTGIDLVDGPGGVRLVATCRTPIGAWRMEASGETIVEAIAGLHRVAAEDRVAVGFRVLVGR